MIKTTRVGNTVVCFLENKMYQRNFDTDEELISVYETIMNTNEYEPEEIKTLIELLTPPKTEGEIKLEEEFEEKKEAAEANEVLINFMERLEAFEFPDASYEVKDQQLFMKGINAPIPEFLGRKIAQLHTYTTITEAAEDERTALKNFWRLCALNPSTRCREDLYGFLSKNKMTITPSGCFIAYRNVNIKKEGNKKLTEFISKQWAQVKKWKKSPKNYGVYVTDKTKYSIMKVDESFESSVGSDYKTKNIPITPDGVTVPVKTYGNLSESEDPHFGEVYIGNLADLYNNLSNQDDKDTTIYTDGWSGKMAITIGEPVSIPRNQCDSNSSATCSRGLHAANSQWLKSGYFGSTGLAVLINPMNVISCPYADSGKLRCCEYMPVSVIEFDENEEVIPFDCSIIDIDYGRHTEAQLLDMLNATSFTYNQDQRIVPLDMSFSEYYGMVNDYAKSLNEMTAIINNRITDV